MLSLSGEALQKTIQECQSARRDSSRHKPAALHDLVVSIKKGNLSMDSNYYKTRNLNPKPKSYSGDPQENSPKFGKSPNLCLGLVVCRVWQVGGCLEG